MRNRFFAQGAWVELYYFIFIDILLIRCQQVKRIRVTFILRPIGVPGSGGCAGLYWNPKKVKQSNNINSLPKKVRLLGLPPNITSTET